MVVVGSVAVLIFHSDSVVQLRGFHLSFTFQQGTFNVILGKSWLLGLNLGKRGNYIDRASTLNIGIC